MRLVSALVASFAIALAALPAAAQFGPMTLHKVMPEARGNAVAVNASGMEAFIADTSGNRVAVVDQLSTVKYIPVGREPRFIAASGSRFYASSGDGTLAVRTGELSVTTIGIGGSGPMQLDAANNAYVLRLRQDGRVVIVNGASLSWRAVDTGSATTSDFAVNANGSRLFVVDPEAGEVRLFDLGVDLMYAKVRIPGRPRHITYNEGSNRVYVVSDDPSASFVEIDASSGASRVISTGNGLPNMVKASAGLVYAAFAGELMLLDIRADTLQSLPLDVRKLQVDSIGGKTYALGVGVVAAIDTLSMRYETFSVGSEANDIAFIYKTCKVYVPGVSALTVLHAPCGDIAPSGINAQGLWWVPGGRESGWGLNITHQGNTLFATWFTYGPAGQPMWLVMSNGMQIGRNSYEGALYLTDGPSFASAVFDPARVSRAQVGQMRIDVFSTTAAQLTATVNGTTFYRLIGKQQFARAMPLCGTDLQPGAAPNFTDLWWASPAGSESGWGLNIQHQGDTLFITWFTYETMQSVWFVGSNIARTGPATYSGTLYRTNGPPLSASPWDPSRVQRTAVGNATLEFRDAANGTFTYTVGATSASKQITRQVYAAPTSACH